MPLIDLNGLGHFKDRENAMIAENFAATKDYAAGDYCYFNGTLYKFKTAHAAGAWTIADVEAAKLAHDVSDLKESTNDLKTASFEWKRKSFVGEFAKGTIGGAGQPAISNNRVRTGYNAYFITHQGKIIPKEGYQVRVFYYKNGSTFDHYYGYFTNPYIMETGYTVRIIAGKTDDSDITAGVGYQAFDLFEYVNVVSELKTNTEPLDLIDVLVGDNLPVQIASTSRFIKASDGTGSSSDAYRATNFVDVSNYDYIIYAQLHRTNPLISDAGMAFYSNTTTESYISGEFIGSGTEENIYIPKLLKVPEGAKYARFTEYKEAVNDFYVKGINLNPLKNLKLSLLGDSISTFANTNVIPSGNDIYYTGSNDGVISYEEVWWKMVCNCTGMKPLVIDAWSGSSIAYNYATDASHSDTNKIPMCSDLRTGRLSANDVNPDVIIIAGGLNDWSYSASTTTPLGDWDGRTAISREDVVSGNSTFIKSYASMINKLQENYPSAIIVCCSVFFCSRGTDNGITHVNDEGYTINDYNQAIKKVCEIMGVPYIDIYNVGFNYGNYYPTYCEDDATIPTHPNAVGHAVIAGRVIEELPRLVKQFK